MSSQVTSRFVPYPEQVRFSTLKRWNLSTCFGNHITNTRRRAAISSASPMNTWTAEWLAAQRRLFLILSKKLVFC
jgi:hypothetical protein